MPVRPAAAGRRRLRQPPSVATPTTMAVVVGLLYLAAGAVGDISTLAVRPPGTVPLVTIATAAVVAGSCLIRCRTRVPLAVLRLQPSIGIALILAVVLLAGDPSLARAFGALFGFVVLDAYLFFEWRFAAAHWGAGALAHLAATAVTGVPVVEVLVAQVILGVLGVMIGWLVRLAADVGVDTLTALPDRRRSDLLLERAVAHAAATGAHLTVALLDLDGLGRINQERGVHGGDEVLAATGARLLQVSAPHGVAARYGSDEFLLILPGVDVPAALRLLDDLAGSAPAPFCAGLTAVTVTDSRASVTTRLVNALHQAGDGHAVVLAEDSTRAAVRLRAAIADGELELHYQPIVAVAAGGHGVEALVRWRCDGVLVPPDAFIPQAEWDGTIVDVGRWVLAQACADLASWQGVPGMPDRVSVNTSHAELCRPEHADLVLGECERHGLTPSALVLEVTETTLGREDDVVRANLTRLRDAGVGVSVDDFGTGYSSLARLEQLPVTELKIDRRFVTALDPQADGPLPVLVAIVTLARALGVDLVAEGVERPGQAEVLVRLGVPKLQGYLLGRPVPAADLPAVLRACPDVLTGLDVPSTAPAAP